MEKAQHGQQCPWLEKFNQKCRMTKGLNFGATFRMDTANFVAGSICRVIAYVTIDLLKTRNMECEEAVIKKIRSRRDIGRKKYGVSMERTDLTRLQWLRHAQEEAMDLAIYLERLIREETLDSQ